MNKLHRLKQITQITDVEFTQINTEKTCHHRNAVPPKTPRTPINGRMFKQINADGIIRTTDCIGDTDE